jgi:NADPH-dependent FMN reductase
MPRIGIILGSTRPNRNGEQVARWVFDLASERDDAEYELVDLRDYPLPHLDEPLPPSFGQYANDHTKEWAPRGRSRSAAPRLGRATGAGDAAVNAAPGFGPRCPLQTRFSPI